MSFQKATSAEEILIPSNKTAKEFGKVELRKEDDKWQVQVTILMEPEGEKAEGWQTGVAIDSSVSMKAFFGRMFQGDIPKDVEHEYEKKGWMSWHTKDGIKFRNYSKEAQQDAIQKGYLHNTPNIVEPIAQDFIAYLAGNLDADGGTTVIYWACGDGSELEVLGDFREEQCKTLKLQGPTKTSFGNKTILKNAMKYFVDLFVTAKRGMYIFITDGQLDDLEDVKKYTIELAKEISAEKRNFVKCVLIGVGDKIDENQMEQLDNLDTGTDVDIWDHKIAKELRSLSEIFAEVVSENQIIASTGIIYDSNGKVAKKYTDGLPAKIEFTLPNNAEWFELEVSGRKIRQTILLK